MRFRKKRHGWAAVFETGLMAGVFVTPSQMCPTSKCSRQLYVATSQVVSPRPSRTVLYIMLGNDGRQYKNPNSKFFSFSQLNQLLLLNTFRVFSKYNCFALSNAFLISDSFSASSGVLTCSTVFSDYKSEKYK